MLGFTYNQLFEALQSWTEDDADEYLDIIPRLIQLGELRLVKDLNLELNDITDDTIVVTGNSRLVPKPIGLITTRSLWLIISGTKSRLDQRSRDFCENFAPTPATLATPRYYCEYSETQWYLAGTPNQSCTAQAIFLKRPDGLSVSNQNTWLGDNCGDLLLCCTLMESEHWVKADDRYADMKSKYETELLPVARAEMHNIVRAGQYSPYRPAAQSAG